MYLGNQPALSYTSFAKQDFTTSATTSYTLDHPVTNENELALFINFVRQEPTTAYTASNTSLTLTSATSASDDMYCVFLGKAVQTVNPPNGSVGTAQIADLAVTSGKLASGVLPTNTPAFQATLSGNQTISHNTITKVQFNSETFDTDSSYDPTTNYRFTVPSGGGGKYFIYTSINLQGANNREYETILRIRVNGSDNKITIAGEDLTQSTVMKFNLSTVVSLSATDYVEIYVSQYDYTSSSTVNVLDNTRAVFGGYKLIGV